MTRHETCSHVIHTHLSDEMTVYFYPFDSPRTIHQKMQECCAEVKIIASLKKYIVEFKDAIYQCEGQLEMYACHLHSSIDISQTGDVIIDLEVQALKTGITIVKRFNYFWPKKLLDEIWREAHVMADLVRAAKCPKCEKSGFKHRDSHYTDCITRHVYEIGSTKLKVCNRFHTPRK